MMPKHEKQGARLIHLHAGANLERIEFRVNAWMITPRRRLNSLFTNSQSCDRHLRHFLKVNQTFESLHKMVESLPYNKEGSPSNGRTEKYFSELHAILKSKFQVTFEMQRQTETAPGTMKLRTRRPIFHWCVVLIVNYEWMLTKIEQEPNKHWMRCFLHEIKFT